MRNLGGTETSASRLIAVIVGRIMMASTITAGSTPGPLGRWRTAASSLVEYAASCTWDGSRGSLRKSPQPVDHAGIAASNSMRFFRICSTLVRQFVH